MSLCSDPWCAVCTNERRRKEEPMPIPLNPHATSPVIFLDVDGVLNSWDWHDRRADKRQEIDPEAVDQLHTLCFASGAVVVVSSAWRIPRKPWLQLLRVLRKAHIPVIGRTPTTVVEDPSTPYEGRGNEVKAWRDDYGHSGPYVILDDRDEFLSDQKEHFVMTSIHTGLRRGHVKRAVDILRRKSDV